MTSTALMTDHYELTMVQAALRAGTAHRRSVFELFARKLPEGRRYGVVGGTQVAIPVFDPVAVLTAVQEHGITEEELLKVRGQLAGSTVLGSEDSGSRMSRLGRAEMDSGQFTSTDELLEKIRAVSLDEVRDLAAFLGEQQMITTIVR